MINRITTLFFVSILLTQAQELAKTPDQWMQTGVDAFFDARIADSAEAFDKVIEAVPHAKPQLWQRGITLYYAKRYQDGRDQFETHQTANSNDVENAAWHFLCVARLENVDAARKALIPIEGDTRVPMKQVHDLFAGKGTVDAVLVAAGIGDDSPLRRNHLCYAHLYLGLYFEALGDDIKAKDHILKAAIDYEMDHYMGKTAITHAKVRGWLPAS
jgi:lipoprotein NlpI